MKRKVLIRLCNYFTIPTRTILTKVIYCTTHKPLMSIHTCAPTILSIATTLNNYSFLSIELHEESSSESYPSLGKPTELLAPPGEILQFITHSPNLQTSPPHLLVCMETPYNLEKDSVWTSLLLSSFLV